MEAKFYTLASCVKDITERTKGGKNDAEIVQMALDKAKMVQMTKFSCSTQSTEFRCDLFIDCILVSKGEALNKKTAKHLAFKKAIEVLQKPHLKVKKINEDLNNLRLIGSIERDETSVSSQTQQCHLMPGIIEFGMESICNTQCLADDQRSVPFSGGKRRATELNDILAEFVVMDLVMVNAMTILQRSADLCQVQLKYEFKEFHDDKCHCLLLLDGFLLVDCIGDSKAIAKAEAAEHALKILKEKCYSIISKQNEHGNDKGTIQREAVISSMQKNQTIPESNVGNQLLKKIGWMGGGLGRQGNEGIIEPISLESVINREGLGLNLEKGVSKDFPQKIQQIIEEYMHSEKQEDLVFSPAFTKEERAVIHQQARKYLLKNKSYGQSKDRYLVLSRRRTPMELVAHIFANGGETSKYVLMLPGSS